MGPELDLKPLKVILTTIHGSELELALLPIAKDLNVRSMNSKVGNLCTILWAWVQI